MNARTDLTGRLLTLGAAERTLLVDLYQARFADADLLSGLAALSGADAQALASRGLSRSVSASAGEVHYLSATGQRAALQLEPSARSGGRAYAALRLEHELLRARLYLALRRRGMPPAAFCSEPRLAYRSAAGLGERALVPDASVEADAGWLVEIDRGTEGEAQLRHKWLRYREWQISAGEGAHLGVLAGGAPGGVVRSLAASGVDAGVFSSVEELAAAIWREEDGM